MNCDDLFDKELITHWKKLVHKPKAIVFDLDQTLWPFAIDTNVISPFRKHVNHEKQVVVDANNNELKGFVHVQTILNTLFSYCFNNGEKMAISSRSRRSDLALSLIDLLGWKKYLSSLQIYPSSKINHMYSIRDDLNLKDFHDILFFDDNIVNIESVSQLNVCSYLIEKNKGLDLSSMHQAFDFYQKSFSNKI